MLDEGRRKEILEHGTLSKPWTGEPMLGNWYTEEEIEAVVSAIRNAMSSMDGFGFLSGAIAEFEQKFAEYCDTQYAVSITSAGVGLDMAVIALDLEPGDEVISPAINFKGAHYSILGYGGTLVLCEADTRTLNADPADVEKRITPRTRAILVTHMNGLSAPMDDYLEIAERHPHPKYGPPKVIGDAARSCGGGYKGGKIGNKGWMTVFSFHTMKLMTTLGEGGMLTTDDPQLAQRLRGLRQWGMEMPGDLETDSDKPGTRDPRWGTNYKMTTIQAAVGLVQLRRLDDMIAPRVKLARERTEMLKDIPELTLPYEPPECDHAYYLYNILVPREWAGQKRDRLMKILKEDYGVNTVLANAPTYQQGYPFIADHTAGQRLPISEEIGARLFCPPMHPLMPTEDNEYICAAIAEAVERIKLGE